MTPHDRIRRYAQLATGATIFVCGLLCYFLLISPRISRLNRVDHELADASKQLADMQKEIEDASIAGAPGPGESRYEKFGILGADEEQLFLSDLIDFCSETNNTLNVVRRADTPRSAMPKTTQDQEKGAKPTQGAGEAPAAPRPIIQKVPHTVNYSGTFLSSFHLLRKLETYKRLLTVERVEVGADTREGYPRVNGNITIDLYLVKNPGQPLPSGEEGASPRGEVASSAEGGTAGEGGQG
jgi:hypothetical protein